MSRYPDNPLWDHERDIPIMIMTRLEWEEAAEAGALTPEHVIQRLKNIADHVFGNETVIRFDVDGFVVSLIAEGLPLQGGVTLYVYSKDHPPPHVHVKVRAHPNARIRVSLETGEFLDTTPRGVRSKELKRFQAAVRENRHLLAIWWEAHTGDPVVIR